MYLNLVFQITHIMQYFPYPVVMTESNAEEAATYLWLTVEIFCFVSIIISNCLFMALRTCFHHKVQMDKVAEKK
jgi:hypothetical protein